VTAGREGVCRGPLLYPLLWYPECGAGEALLSRDFLPERMGFFFEELKLFEGSTWMAPELMLRGGDDGGVERSAGFWA
jgi:hypothetical protein